jgi:hypothetical protein
MSKTEPTRISLLADGTRADARRMLQQALRLRDAAEKLRGLEVTPDWFAQTIRSQITRCMVAAEDLELASARLDEHAKALLGKGVKSA